MKNFCSKVFQGWVALVVILQHIALACSDPCPSVQRANRFRDTGMVFWDKKYSTAPERIGVTSYHVDGSRGLANYIAFIGNKDTVLVGEADCELSNPKWQFLQWQTVDKDEFLQVKAIEAIYPGIEVQELKKANYVDNKTVYFVKTELQGKSAFIFRMFGSNGYDLTGAFAWPIAIAPKS